MALFRERDDYTLERVDFDKCKIIKKVDEDGLFYIKMYPDEAIAKLSEEEIDFYTCSYNTVKIFGYYSEKKRDEVWENIKSKLDIITYYTEFHP